MHSPIALSHYRLPRRGSKLDFGYRRFQRPDGSWHYHQGLDFPAPVGTPLFAVDGGQVTHVHGGAGPLRGFDGYGRLVVLQLQNGLFALYAHVELVHVRQGDWLTRGQLIAEVGGTAFSRAQPAHRCAPHLHFELARTRYPKPRDRKPADWGRVDPSVWLAENVHAVNGR